MPAVPCLSQAVNPFKFKRRICRPRRPVSDSRLTPVHLVSAASLYRLVGPGSTTATPYGLSPVATVAVVLRVLGSMIDSVFAPWFAT